MKLVLTTLYQNLNETIAIVVKPARHIMDEDMTLKMDKLRRRGRHVFQGEESENKL